MSSKVHKIRDVFANNFCVELIFYGWKPVKKTACKRLLEWTVGATQSHKIFSQPRCCFHINVTVHAW